MSQAVSEELIDENDTGPHFIRSLIAIEESTGGCTVENTRKLFKMYCVDESIDALQPLDVREMLFNILEAFRWPLVVPDESLDTVFKEMSLNEKTFITWVEFKSFFVFLQDRPLHKLLELVTKDILEEDLATAKIVMFDPVQPLEKPHFERALFQQLVRNMLGDTPMKVYVHFLGGSGNTLALAIGKFDKQKAEVLNGLEIGNDFYNVKIQPFDVNLHVFPPIQRAGGWCSKVARKIADMYVVSTEWDQSHLKIFQRTFCLAKFATKKCKTIDQIFGIQDKFSRVTKKILTTVKAIDESLQVTQRIGSVVKRLDYTFDISGRLKNSKRFQQVSAKASALIRTSLDTFDLISKETKQMVNEKEIEHCKVEEKQVEAAQTQHDEQTPETSDFIHQKMFGMDDEGDMVDETIGPFSKKPKD